MEIEIGVLHYTMYNVEPWPDGIMPNGIDGRLGGLKKITRSCEILDIYYKLFSSTWNV